MQLEIAKFDFLIVNLSTPKLENIIHMTSFSSGEMLHPLNRKEKNVCNTISKSWAGRGITNTSGILEEFPVITNSIERFTKCSMLWRVCGNVNETFLSDFKVGILVFFNLNKTFFTSAKFRELKKFKVLKRLKIRTPTTFSDFSFNTLDDQNSLKEAEIYFTSFRKTFQLLISVPTHELLVVS